MVLFEKRLSLFGKEKSELKKCKGIWEVGLNTNLK